MCIRAGAAFFKKVEFDLEWFVAAKFHEMFSSLIFHFVA